MNGTPLGFNPSAEELFRNEKRLRAEAKLIASKEAAGRIHAGSGSASPQLVQLFQPRAPVLPAGFAKRKANIKAEPVRIDRETLLVLAKQRFVELLEADAVLRAEQTAFGPLSDFTSFPNIKSRFGTLGALALSFLPRSKFGDVDAEIKEQARSIRAFSDLWKAGATEPRLVREVYKFRDLFESLVCAQSIMNRLGQTGDTVSSSLFLSGLTNPLGVRRHLRLLEPWRSAFVPTRPARSFLAIEFKEVLPNALCWLAQDVALAEILREPDPSAAIASLIFECKRPSAEQRRIAEKVFQAFLCGCDAATNHDGPHLAMWLFTGEHLERTLDLGQLSVWRQILAKKFPDVAAFHRCFFPEHLERRTGSWPDHTGFLKLDVAGYRTHLDNVIGEVISTVDALSILACGKEARPVAAFPGELTLESKIAPEELRRVLDQALSDGFGPSSFAFRIQEKQTL